MSHPEEINCSVGPTVKWTEVEHEVVWLTEERTYGYLIRQGAHTSLVRYTIEDGEVVEDEIENNEFEEWGEHALDYESE